MIVDDHLLLKVLLDDEPSALRPASGRLFTTGLWYHRLCRALADRTVRGAMSRSLGDAAPQFAAGAITAVTTLPESIGLASLRELSWPMAELVAGGARLNLMSLEALAAARWIDAEICLAVEDENPQLIAAAEEQGVSVRLVA